MAEFTNQEMAQMHFMYGLANGNAGEARRLYAERFPNRRIPCPRTFTRLHLRLEETGSFAESKIRGPQFSVRTPELEENVLNIVEESPGTSTRKIGNELNVSHKTVWRILKDYSLYPYHIQRVQALLPQDFLNRVNFCNWFQENSLRVPNFSKIILFTDEANFSRNKIMNFHNDHMWAENNPHAIIEGRHQHQFSVNVWAGIIGNILVGPHFFPNRLNGDVYYNFIRDDLPELMDAVPLRTRLLMWFMHDGAPPHFAIAVRNYLNQQYPDRWIGRGGPHQWPARSPDLNPLDFYLWGHLKQLVYSTPIETVDELQLRIINGFNMIRARPEIFQLVRDNLSHRVDGCLLAHGGHFQQFI
jgi:Helix-turn-helix domain (DUF4817)